jgi:two-component system cell cycle response regulator DivK
VIEDNLTHVKLAHLVLSAAGPRVRDVETAERAFSAIKQEKPEVILLDLALHSMDGLTLVRQLKADPEARAIPIIAVTSDPDRFKIKRCGGRSLRSVFSQTNQYARIARLGERFGGRSLIHRWLKD